MRIRRPTFALAIRHSPQTPLWRSPQSKPEWIANAGHGPMVHKAGQWTCLRMQNCTKCNKAPTDWCNSSGHATRVVHAALWSWPLDLAMVGQWMWPVVVACGRGTWSWPTLAASGWGQWLWPIAGAVLGPVVIASCWGELRADRVWFDFIEWTRAVQFHSWTGTS